MAKEKIDLSLDTSQAVDFDETKEKKVLVDPGTYLTVVSKAEPAISKKKTDKEGNPTGGNPMVVVEFAIKGGKFSGEKLNKYLVLRGKGSGVTRKTLLAFHDDTELVEGFKVDPDALMGEKAIIQVAEDEYTNEHGTFPSRKITAVLRADDEAGLSAVQATANTQSDEEGGEGTSSTEEPPF